MRNSSVHGLSLRTYVQERLSEVGSPIKCCTLSSTVEVPSRQCAVVCSSLIWTDSFYLFLNRLTPNDPYMGRTAPFTTKRCILYIYSTNIGTEYFKHALYSPFFSLQNAVCFIMLTCVVTVLFTFYIQGVLKLKK